MHSIIDAAASKDQQELLEHLNLSREELLADYQLASESRQASLIGRKEVFMGKAKFGIFGDGKELPQIAMAKAFKAGDMRSGYYRDQTFMLATGMLTLQQYFAQLYAHTSVEAEPASAGRMMNGHFGSRLLDENGDWLDQLAQPNSSSDISPTGSQMPRLLGMAYASKLYRNNPLLANHQAKFSHNGDEIAWGTIGNASTSEGMFYEVINAGGVLQVPMVVSVWDDEYGISVPKEYHTTKGNISEVLHGFAATDSQAGYAIYRVNGWDYLALVATYQKAAEQCRTKHEPAIVHVQQLTQPQGHSTSGSHERYKDAERLAWEAEHDCNLKFRNWLIAAGIASEADLDQIDQQAKRTAAAARAAAWDTFCAPIKEANHQVATLLSAAAAAHDSANIKALSEQIAEATTPQYLDGVKATKQALRELRDNDSPAILGLKKWLKQAQTDNADRFNSCEYSKSVEAAGNQQTLRPTYDQDAPLVDGREVVRQFFDQAFARDQRIFAIGEDVGKIGDVNQGFAGLQEKYGALRITDTGIRECSIVGQGIGAAMRGLRPIVEIQYLDYFLYALQILSDDVATMQYRTRGGQKSPLIVRTRGHRLEGIWHSGSPMGTIIHSLRGMHVLVPRNMTQAASFYNTLLASDEPALVIECLNGYRLKEAMPNNLDTMQLALGEPEVLRQGTDVTIVTYGSMCRIVMDAADGLQKLGISAQVIDVQSLLPFDTKHTIVQHLKQTNRLIFADEDVPGGATSFMMQQVLEVQNGYRWLDSAPLTVTAKAHRPPYGSDGDYFSKPSADDVLEAAYNLMHEAMPTQYPTLW